MGSAISLRSDFGEDGLRILARQTKVPTRRGGSLHLHRSMMAALALMRRGSAASRCRSWATGWCGSTRAVPMGCQRQGCGQAVTVEQRSAHDLGASH